MKDFASRCRRMAATEADRRLRAMFIKMAEDYDRRADDGQDRTH